MTKHLKSSFLCPNCRKLISAGQSVCPYCGIKNPGAWWKIKSWTSGDDKAALAIKTIIYVNTGMFILSLLFSYPTRAGFSPSQRSLLLLGATGTLPIDRLHRWWSLIAANYLHGNIIHILFNMIAFWQIAPLITQEYGTYRMVIIYSISGVVGFFISYLAGVPFTIGASAAVCGLIGAALYYGKSRGGTYGRTIYGQMGSWIVGLFIFGLLVPGINNWGHGGGVVAGILLGFILDYNERKKEQFYHKGLAGLCTTVTAIILVWAVITTVAA